MGAAILGSLILIGEDPPQPAPEVDGLRAEVAALRAVVQEQASRVRRAGGDRAAADPTAREQPRSVEEPTPGSPKGSDDRTGGQDRPPPATYERSQARVLDAYAGEAVDASWSGEASRKLNALVRDHLPSGSQLTSLECRTTMCQIEIVHADAKAHGAFLLDGLGGWPGSVFVARREQRPDDLAVTLVAAREGTELPLGPR